MDTKLDKLLTYSESLPSLKPHDPLIMLPTWGYVIIWKFFIFTTTIFMGRIRLDEDFLKPSWRRLSPSSSEDVLIKTNIFALVIRLQKTSSRRLDQDKYICLGHAFSRRFQNVFKTSCQDVFQTSSRHFQDVLQNSLQDIFKTYWRCFKDVLKTPSRYLQDVFKTFSRRLAKMSSRHLQDVFETYHQVKLFLLTNLQDIFKTYSIRFWDVLRRQLSTEKFN